MSDINQNLANSNHKESDDDDFTSEVITTESIFKEQLLSYKNISTARWIESQTDCAE